MGVFERIEEYLVGAARLLLEEHRAVGHLVDHWNGEAQLGELGLQGVRIDGDDDRNDMILGRWVGKIRRHLNARENTQIENGLLRGLAS